MASPPDQVLRLRQLAEERATEWPRIVVAGPILQRPVPFRHPLVRSVASAQEARQVVDELSRRGVDFIKVGDTLTREVYFALAEQARRRRIPLAGHLPAGVGALEASRAGQRSIEHFGDDGLNGVLIACSSEEAELMKFGATMFDDALDGNPSPELLEARIEAIEARLFGSEFTSRLVDTYSASKAQALFAEFARNRTWQVPTLLAIRDAWSARGDKRSQEDIRARERLWARHADAMAAMRRAGVKFLAGTDVPWPEDRAVAPLHDELVLLVEAGFTPMEALQAATRNAAEFLGTLASQGTVEVGKLADLVVLDASPLDHIENTRRIRAVVRAGRLSARPPKRAAP
jgi:Amidohydrolase family